MIPGYKQSEVGMIPEDWHIESLDSIADVTSGKRLPLGYLVSSEETPYPYIRVTDMYPGGLNTKNIKYVPAKAYPFIKNYRIFKEDLFISVAGSLGVAGKIPPELDGANLTENANRISALKCDRDYLLYVILSPIVQSVIESIQTVGAQPKLALTRIRSFAIPLPPTVEEQRAIATALSDMDALLDGLDRLIYKKRAVKQAAMQQLLTGQTRLPGFSGEWKLKRLGDTATLKARIGWQGLTTAEYLTDGEFYLVTGTEFENGYINWKRCHFVTENRYKQDKYIQLKPHDVLVTKDGTIGKIALVSALPAPTTLNSGIFVIRPIDNNFHPEFFYYLLCSKIFDEFLTQLSAGSTINHLYQKDFIDFTYRAPPTLEEQTEIAAILSNMDAEIATFESRRDKTRALKQAMMQELLTGRTRLVKADAMAEEAKPTQTGSHQANVHFIRSVLAAEIVDRLHQQPTFGHVKFEKMMFLVEQLCDVETGSTYHRKAAGPYDNRALRSIDSQLRKQHWFDARKEGERYRYAPMKNRGGHKRYFDRYFSNVDDMFEKILRIFRKADTQQCEVVATLLAAWGDLLRERETVSDEMIVHEVLNNWHERKKRISEDTWLKALSWMRSQGFVPKGAT